MLLCARHHVQPGTCKMLRTSQCLLSLCSLMHVHNCKDFQGCVGAYCHPLWLFHSQISLLHFWLVCLSVAFPTYDYNIRLAVILVFLVHLLPFPRNNSQERAFFSIPQSNLSQPSLRAKLLVFTSYPALVELLCQWSWENWGRWGGMRVSPG